MTAPPRPFYELIVLGAVTPPELEALRVNLETVAAEFQLALGSEIALRTLTDFADHNREASITALYFGGNPQQDAALVD